MLPVLADTFGITMDELFGREAAMAPLPWADDETLRVVLYGGHRYIAAHPLAQEVHFCYEGPALNIHSALSIHCDHVEGSVTAGGSVTCDNVGGSVSAQGNVTCDNVEGNVSAGGNAACDQVRGHLRAGGNVTCDVVQGSVTCGGDFHADFVGGLPRSDS